MIIVTKQIQHGNILLCKTAKGHTKDYYCTYQFFSKMEKVECKFV